MYFKIIRTPVGMLLLRAGTHGLTAVQWHRPGASDVSPNGVADDNHPLLLEAERQLHEYFDSRRRVFSLPLHFTGTDFQREVWHALLAIPYGTTVSYAAMARRIGNENAVRAIGGAVNKNPIAIIAPCHRVIGSNGTLVGFASGLANKAQLLRLEKRNLPFFEAL